MSKLEFNQGVEHAKRIISDACQFPKMFYSGSGLEDVIGNLENALTNKPADYAAGVMHVVKAARDALRAKQVTH